MDIASTVPPVATIAPKQQAGLTWHAGIVALALALAGLIGGFVSTATAMVGIWARSETFMHGFLIAPISAWLIWRLRGQLSQIVPRPSYWALLPLVAAGAAWLVGELAAVNALSQFAFVAMLVLAVPMTLGWTVARAITFPLAFLFFMVPFGEFLLPPLMDGTANFTVEALRASGVPVYREGLQFVIPSGSWSVVEACSGVRYLIASMVAGSLFAYLNYRSTRRRVVFFVVSILVPIVANWVRAFMIVMLGHLSNNKIAVGVDHLIYGWVFFGVVLLLLFWVGSFWREPDEVGDGAAPVRTDTFVDAGRGFGHAVPSLAAFAVAVAIWPLADRVLEHAGTAPAPVLAAPAVPASWTETTGGLTEWTPRFVGVPTQLHATYRHEGVSVGLYIGYYRDQADGRKLISSENTLVTSDDRKWTMLGSGNSKSEVASGPVEIRETVLKRVDGLRLVTWQWYWVDGKTTASDVVAKLYALQARLAGRGDDGAVVIVSTRADTPRAARAALERFVRDAGPAIEVALQRTRDRR
jgi:exosortase A